MTIYNVHLHDTMTVTDNVQAEVIRRIESNPSIPEYAKQAVKDFVSENWIELVSNTISYIPDNITDYMDVINEIIKSI